MSAEIRLLINHHSTCGKKKAEYCNEETDQQNTTLSKFIWLFTRDHQMHLILNN